MRRPRVLLADDHPMMLEGLIKLLEPSCEVVGRVTDGRALLAAVERLRPDLVVTDISMPEMDGLEATRRIRAAHPGVLVLILSIHTEHSWVSAAFEAGASGYLTKTSAPEEIESAVRDLLEGQFFVSSAVTPGVVTAAVKAIPEVTRRAPPEACETLTPRETDIVRLVGHGLGNKEIAQRLGVSVATVRTHLSKVYGKLGTVSRIELAILAALASLHLQHRRYAEAEPLYRRLIKLREAGAAYDEWDQVVADYARLTATRLDRDR